MKKLMLLFVMLTLFVSFSGRSQENNSKTFSYRSFSLSPIGVYFGNTDGLSLAGDISFDYGVHIFSIGLETGTEGQFISHNDSHYQANILYGREFPISEKVNLEAFAGTGYFKYEYQQRESLEGKKHIYRGSTIGFPVGAKFRYQIGPRFSLGLLTQVNFNSAETVVNFGILLQWNRQRN